ncbi:hypothetical protein MSKU9_0313 [Komagataeibacter diospyri]|uniref:Uncharacterized protein n=1 Tax=Komagataeibacter diospyri TaxID=1932662 RepID=A0A4V0WM23_9PROT|nr:hypothetical protein MSKU9_0313 [Komagataeibacter diospyri]
MRALPWRNMAAAGQAGPIVCYDILISNIYDPLMGGGSTTPYAGYGLHPAYGAGVYMA